MATLERYLASAMETLERIEPCALGHFARKYAPDLLHTPNRVSMSVTTRITRLKPGDYRDWDAIRAWARELDLGQDTVAHRVL